MNRRPAKPIILLLLLALLISGAWAAAPNIGVIYTMEQGDKLVRHEDPLQTYRDAIIQSGGRVVVLWQGYDKEFLDFQLGQIDGLLIPGGDDVNPALYGEEKHETTIPDETGLDRFETEIIKVAMDKKIPVLGICRGLQIMNVYLGGTLIQDIPSMVRAENKVIHRKHKEGGDECEPCYHYVTADKDGLFARLMGSTRIRTNSYHHQAIKDLAPGLKITARADDGVIEAVEGTGDHYILCFQFHPELMLKEDPRFYAIFQAFMAESAKKSKSETRDFQIKVKTE